MKAKYTQRNYTIIYTTNVLGNRDVRDGGGKVSEGVEVESGVGADEDEGEHLLPPPITLSNFTLL